MKKDAFLFKFMSFFGVGVGAVPFCFMLWSVGGQFSGRFQFFPLKMLRTGNFGQRFKKKEEKDSAAKKKSTMWHFETWI